MFFTNLVAGVFALGAAPVLGGGAGHDLHGPADAWVYPIAAPGTYALPPILEAADARLLDETGREVGLRAMFDDRLTVMAFMYTRCGDVCPMAAGRMIELQALAAGDPAIAGALRLISLSFDPRHDTPAVMADYAGHLRSDEPGAPIWAFLTAPDAATIAPVLEAYDQPVARKRDADDSSGPFSHILRVFLIDREGRVRNIYSADFLDPRLVLNDLRTLLLETS
jgi:cytochrome oxidase Cu insertion factor (SCO1/SenC/PrrC family)